MDSVFSRAYYALDQFAENRFKRLLRFSMMYVGSDKLTYSDYWHKQYRTSICSRYLLCYSIPVVPSPRPHPALLSPGEIVVEEAEGWRYGEHGALIEDLWP